MTDRSGQAFPSHELNSVGEYREHDRIIPAEPGMTKREVIAMHALPQCIERIWATEGKVVREAGEPPSDLYGMAALMAVKAADALLQTLSLTTD